MRFDKLLAITFYYLFHRIRDSLKFSKIPILMYHSISANSLPGKQPYYQTHTTPHVFSVHMRLLKENNFRVVSLNDAAALLEEGPIKERLAVITFDDGYRDFLTAALPVLRHYGYPATVFISTSHVGTRPGIFYGKECLSWSEIVDLSKLRDVEIGSHTKNHKIMDGLSLEDLETEILGSKDVLETRIEKAVKGFSFPYAFPERKFWCTLAKNFLFRADYQYAVTTRIGRTHSGDDLFTLKRIPINDFDNANLFLAKLYGFYGWMYYLQRAKKQILPAMKKQ